MIPKIIHYCWFGGNPLPESAKKCINSWRKYLPDYSIKEWNENNFDIHCCRYVEQAYEQKKWAFVSDYARFWILYHEGGVYFDTDVELIQPLEIILKKGPFFGIERGNPPMVAPGLGMAALPNMNFYKKVLENYQEDFFINGDGHLNLTVICTRITDLLYQYGMHKGNFNQIIQVQNIWIYPAEYFCPLDYYTGKLVITENTYSIHHYDGSWTSTIQQKRNSLKYKYYDLFSRFLNNKTSYFISDKLARLISLYREGGIYLVFNKLIGRIFYVERKR